MAFYHIARKWHCQPMTEFEAAFFTYNLSFCHLWRPDDNFYSMWTKTQLSCLFNQKLFLFVVPKFEYAGTTGVEQLSTWSFKNPLNSTFHLQNFFWILSILLFRTNLVCNGFPGKKNSIDSFEEKINSEDISSHTLREGSYKERKVFSYSVLRLGDAEVFKC